MKSNDNPWSGVKDGIKYEITSKSMTTNEVHEIKMALDYIKWDKKKKWKRMKWNWDGITWKATWN